MAAVANIINNEYYFTVAEIVKVFKVTKAYVYKLASKCGWLRARKGRSVIYRALDVAGSIGRK